MIDGLTRPHVGAVTPAINALDDPDSARGYGMRFTNETFEVDWLGKEADVPYAIPLVCGCFMAIRREVFEELGGFDPGMTLWGSEDLELSVHLWLRGYECRVLPRVTVAHRFSDSFRYPINWEPLYNRLRMGAVHLNAKRFSRLLAESESDMYFPAVWDHLVQGDVWQRRNSIQQSRVHDDDWYFERFPAASC